MVYQNFLRELWSIVVAFDPFPSTNEPKKCPLKEFLIKCSVSNEQQPLTLDFKIFCSSTSLDYNNGKYVDHPTPEVLGRNYSSTEQDSSKVTNIELTAHMIAINNLRDSVSPPPLVAKPKKWKSQTVTPTLPKSQGPKASRALSKKRKQPKFKRPPTKTKESPPKPTEDFEQSHSGTATHPKDSGGNEQPLDRDATSMTPDDGMAKITLHPKGSLGDKDSGRNIPPTDMELIHPFVADLSRTNVRPILLSEDEAQESDEEVLADGDDIDEDP
ncbi:hypothetical protein Tco_1310869 [Tanacetum coccineum]